MNFSFPSAVDVRPKIGGLSIDLAMELFSYDPESGLITRRKTTGGQLAGSSAGSLRPDGYLSIRFRGQEVLAHRMAWFLHHGSEAEQEIDHINGKRSDNRASNLREASRTTNNQNRRKAHSNNKLGILGVQRTSSGKFLARIRVNKKLIRIGKFNTQEAASDAYVQAKRNLHDGGTL